MTRPQLAWSLAQINGKDSTPGSSYTPTPLVTCNTSTTPNQWQTNPSVSAAVQAALARAASLAGGAFNTTALSVLDSSGSQVLCSNSQPAISNGQVSITGVDAGGGANNLTNPFEIVVKIDVPFSPGLGLFLRRAVFHLTTRGSAITPKGQLG